MAAPAGVAPEPAAGDPPVAAATVPQQAEAPAEELPDAEPTAPELAAPELVAPELVAPELADSELADQELAAPELAAPELAAPELAAPELVAPELADSELADPGLGAAELADSELAGDASGDEEAAAEVWAGEGGQAGSGRVRRRGRALAVVGVVFGILVLAGVAVIGLAIATHGFKPKTVVTYRPAAVFRLQPGECLNSSANGLTVTVLPCATPHQAEVFATFSLSGTSWPGSAAAQQEASSGCASRISGYLNPQLLTAGLSQQFVFPDQKAWQAGVRTVVCEVSSSTGPLTGSVRQSGLP